MQGLLTNCNKENTNWRHSFLHKNSQTKKKQYPCLDSASPSLFHIPVVLTLTLLLKDRSGWQVAYKSSQIISKVHLYAY